MSHVTMKGSGECYRTDKDGASANVGWCEEAWSWWLGESFYVHRTTLNMGQRGAQWPCV